MNAVFLIVIILSIALQSVAQKEYNKKTENGVFTFAAAGVFFAIPVFVIGVLGGFNFSAEILPYALAFATVYSCATVFSFLAINSGPFSLTNLISSYSLILPAIYGIALLDEPISIALIIGILLLMCSLVFINCESKGEPKKITLKWMIFVFMAFVSNGSCSIVQRIQQINCDGRYKNEFMIIALCVSTAVLGIIAVFKGKKRALSNLKKGFWWCLLRGVLNGIVNLLVIVLALKIPASVMFPIISAGGIITAVCIALFLYKEKLTRMQLAGLALGIVSVVFLNL